jgi:hypothetical protein
MRSKLAVAVEETLPVTAEGSRLAKWLVIKIVQAHDDGRNLKKNLTVELHR